MKGKYFPISDGFGIIGFSYKCPNCGCETDFSDCEQGCDYCGFSEQYVDQDSWYDEEMKKDTANRSWNSNGDEPKNNALCS